MKTTKRIFFAALSLIAVNTASAFALDKDQAEAWQEDIEFYHATLAERHINLYHSISEERFSAELERLIAELPNLSEHQVIFELMRITRLVGDGHTQLPIMGGPHKHFPFKFRLFGDDVHVIAASDEYSAYLGARVTAIDGTATSSILDQLSPAVQPVENQYSLMASLTFHLTVDDMLYAAGITDKLGGATFSFELSDGSVRSVPITSLLMKDYVAQTKNKIERRNSVSSEPVLIHSPDLWMSSDQVTKTAYIYFASYPSLEDMTAFGEKVSEYLDAEGIRNLVIDLRDNGGGDFYAGLALSSPILMTDSLDWQDGVYVLIGRHTYSAAMSNAAQFRQLLNAKLIGEPTGGNPVSYSEVGQFHLPNSGRMVIFSKRFYRFQAEDTQGVLPDVYINVNADEFIDGADPFTDWVMNDVRNRAQP